MKRSSTSIVLFAIGSLACGVAHADIATAPPSQDNTIFSESNTLSNGAGDYFFAGRNNAGNSRRGLLAFDIAGSIPAGSTITSVQLTMYMSRSKQGSDPVDLHRALTDWGEGASDASAEEGAGAPATDNDATWRYTFYDTGNPPGSPAWTSLGGDFAPTASASVSVGNDGQYYTWGSTAGMVADVQFWLDNPGGNYGWLLLSNETTNRTAARFNSRTNPTTATRPVLSVTFTPPAGTGACCFTDGTCQVLSPTDCANQSGSYRGDGSTCTPNPCPQPTGACCLSSGSCIVATDPNCVSQGGVYQGDAVPCDPNLCTIPTGACCFNDGTCQVLSAADCGAAGGTYQGNDVPCDDDLCPIILEPFVDPLPIPALATPTSGTPGGVATYDIDMTEFRQQLHRDLPPTTVWGYNGTYPGPTILASTGNSVTVNWINDLRDPNGSFRTDHYLDVDLCPHGAENEPKTVVHVHGAHVPAAADGYPEDTFLPGGSATYVYPNNQQASTIWYHDHALGITRLNVYMGLAGFYIVTDAVEQALDLPTGAYDIGMAIQDRSFHSDGSWKYPSAWQEHFFGDKMLVNGKVWPYHNVEQGKYRLRLLNGCNSRTLTLAFDNAMTFDQIGVEGGLFEQPVTISQVTLGPAERADVIVDFAPYPPGTEIILTNSAPVPFPGTPGVGVIPNVMKFIVQGQAGDTDPVPSSLRTVEPLDPNDAAASREFHLQKFSGGCTGSEWLINGLHWDDITEYPVVGTSEVWSFANRSGISHPMHMHLVFFQILDRQAFDEIGGEIVPVGPKIPPTPSEAGWKDTAMVHPNEITRVIARFDDYQGKYAYHCHILEHEDHEMMRQFQTYFPGDADGDCDVDLTDLALLLTNFDAIGPDIPGDNDKDGDVDLTDLAILLANFDAVCP